MLFRSPRKLSLSISRIIRLSGKGICSARSNFCSHNSSRRRKSSLSPRNGRDTNSGGAAAYTACAQTRGQCRQCKDRSIERSSTKQTSIRIRYHCSAPRAVRSAGTDRTVGTSVSRDSKYNSRTASIRTHGTPLAGTGGTAETIRTAPAAARGAVCLSQRPRLRREPNTQRRQKKIKPSAESMRYALQFA